MAHRSYHQPAFLSGIRDIVYLSNASGQFNLWRQSVPARGGLGREIQLTGFEEWCARMQFPAPSGTEILVFADKDGDENCQIFSVDPRRGWQTPLVNEPDVAHRYGRESYSPDGKYIAYSSNARDSSEMDVVLYDRVRKKAETVMTGGDYMVGLWALDGRRLLVIEGMGGDDNDLILLDIKRRTNENLSPHEDRSFFIPGAWDPSGNGVYVITNRGREFKALGYMDLKTRETRLLEIPEWDVEDVALSPDGRLVAWVVNSNGYFEIHIKNRIRGTQSVRRIMTGGVLHPGMYDPWEYARLLRFSSDSTRICFVLSTPTRPKEVYVLSAGARTPKPCTSGFVGNIPEREMASPKPISFESFDRTIPALIFKPRMKGRSKVPAVIWMHGGLAQEQADYFGPYQYLVNRGICVLAPNIRGSGGYGRTYRRLMHRDWGGADLKDIEAAAKYLRSLDWIDSERIGITGTSLGGFHTLAAITQMPQYWRAAAEACGPSNLLNLTENLPPTYTEYLKEWVGDPDTQRELLESRSPITHIDNVRCPLLVVQGGNDPWVHRSASDIVVERLRSRELEVEYLLYPDEGHDFTKKKNSISAYTARCEFLCKHLFD